MNLRTEDTKHIQEKEEMPQEYRRKTTCSTKTDCRANLRNLEKLVIRKCVTMTGYTVMLPFRQTYVQSVVCLGEIENCGTGG